MFLESVTWTVLIQQLSPHIQSALSNTKSRDLQTWSLLQLPEAWIPSWRTSCGWKEREEMRRFHQNTATWELWLLSQKTEWARAVSFLKKGTVLGLSPIYAPVSSLLFSSVSSWLGQNTPQKCVWTPPPSHALLLKKQSHLLCFQINKCFPSRIEKHIAGVLSASGSVTAIQREQSWGLELGDF